MSVQRADSWSASLTHRQTLGLTHRGLLVCAARTLNATGQRKVTLSIATVRDELRVAWERTTGGKYDTCLVHFLRFLSAPRSPAEIRGAGCARPRLKRLATGSVPALSRRVFRFLSVLPQQAGVFSCGLRPLELYAQLGLHTARAVDTARLWQQRSAAAGVGKEERKP